MSDKRMIDVDELKEMICEHMVGRLWIGTSAIMVIIDSLAQLAGLSRTGDTDIAMCKTCQEFCTTGMPLCEKAKKEIGFDRAVDADKTIESVKTEAIEGMCTVCMCSTDIGGEDEPDTKIC
jgi:hypothetical protein